MTNQATAVVLLSGGLDSATTLALAQRDGFVCHAIAFDYGQRHRFELEAAARVAQQQQAASFRLMAINLAAFGHSALTDTAIAVPEGESGAGIPVTYVPARNTVFLSLALAFAETLGANDIFIGVNSRITPATRTAARISSRPLNVWRVWPPGRAWRARPCASMRPCNTRARPRSSAWAAVWAWTMA